MYVAVSRSIDELVLVLLSMFQSSCNVVHAIGVCAGRCVLSQHAHVAY
jgi:hypothetical protein